MIVTTARRSSPQEVAALFNLLDHHFGDGLVYLGGPEDWESLRRARRLGLVNAEGYMTEEGYRFWRRHAR